jgi:hypothetical protein
MRHNPDYGIMHKLMQLRRVVVLFGLAPWGARPILLHIELHDAFTGCNDDRNSRAVHCADQKSLPAR